MAKPVNQFSSVNSALRKFIERNRATIENYIQAEPSIIIRADGMVELHFVAFADEQLAADLQKEVRGV